MSISAMKFDAFLNEFPFLEQVFADRNLAPGHCDKITIKRADHTLMEYTPKYDGATGGLVGIHNADRVAFVLNDGTVITDAVQDAGYVVHNEAYTDNESWDGETILEAIYGHGVAETLEYIVIVEYGYVIRDHYSQRNWLATIYKPAKDFTYEAIVAEAIDLATAQVEAEAEF